MNDDRFPGGVTEPNSTCNKPTTDFKNFVSNFMNSIPNETCMVSAFYQLETKNCVLKFDNFGTGMWP